MTQRRGWMVYVMLTETGDVGHFKIGITIKLERRVRSIQTGCPFELKGVLFVGVAGRSQAARIERALHDALAAFRTNGEWFVFTLTDPVHKAAFRDATKAVLDDKLGSDWKWRKLSSADLKAADPDRKKAALRKAAAERMQFNRLLRHATSTSRFLL